MLSNMQKPVYYDAFAVFILDLNLYVRVSDHTTRHHCSTVSNTISFSNIFFAATENGRQLLFDVQDHFVE